MNGIIYGTLYLVSLAFLITLFFTFLLKNRGPWGTFWTFFVIVLLAVFAADVWIGPIGPYFYEDVYWVPPLAVGLLIALLLAATTPSPKTRSELDLERKEIADDQTRITVGVFFWFLFVILLVLIIAGMFNNIH